MYHTEEVTPTKPMVRCSPLLLPNNRSITVDYSTQAENGTYILGTTTTYSCSSGFSLNGTQRRVCVEDNDSTMGEFNGSDATCEGKITIAIIMSVLHTSQENEIRFVFLHM